MSIIIAVLFSAFYVKMVG